MGNQRKPPANLRGASSSPIAGASSRAALRSPRSKTGGQISDGPVISRRIEKGKYERYSQRKLTGRIRFGSPTRSKGGSENEAIQNNQRDHDWVSPHDSNGSSCYCATVQTSRRKFRGSSSTSQHLSGCALHGGECMGRHT